MKESIKFISYSGQEIEDLIPSIAKLRIEVFAEYPFLYNGDYEWETRYLRKFLTLEAILVTCFDGDVLIGISTGYPFICEAEDLKELFLSHGRNPNEYFYFGESVLRKSYRGLGIGKKFFVEREAYVQSLGRYEYICFYTSFRPVDDPKRPSDYRPLTPFWESQGFVQHPELMGTVSYQEIGEEEKTPKKMVFWIKEL